MTSYGNDHYSIRAYEAGPDGLAGISTLCNLLQETASRHADEIGFGYRNMLERGLFWVLTRLSLEVYRLPQFGETVTVRTWPKGIRGPFALRDFQILDRDREVVLAATSGWLLIDSESRKPVRLASTPSPQYAIRLIRTEDGAEIVRALISDRSRGSLSVNS